MNRRTLALAVAGAVIAPVTPITARGLAPHNDHPFQLHDYITARGALAVSYRAYDADSGVLPSDFLWLSAYAVACDEADSADAVTSRLPRAIHDCTAALAPRGSFTGPLRFTETDTPGGIQQAEAWTWRTPAGDAALTAMRVGRLVQVIYGPTTGGVREAIGGLASLAASTLGHWPDEIGQDLIPLADVLPSLADLPEGTKITDEVLLSAPWPGR